MPGALPSPVERPFTILFGSCFAGARDTPGDAGATFARLPPDARPDLTVLCGDQVYLDSPLVHFLTRLHPPEELAAEFLATYLGTWTQAGPLSGFRRIHQLASVAFTSDDHDFWNNAPSLAPHVIDTWTERGRTAWLDVAGRLYRQFETPIAVPVDPGRAAVGVHRRHAERADRRPAVIHGRRAVRRPADVDPRACRDPGVLDPRPADLHRRRPGSRATSRTGACPTTGSTAISSRSSPRRRTTSSCSRATSISGASHRARCPADGGSSSSSPRRLRSSTASSAATGSPRPRCTRPSRCRPCPRSAVTTEPYQETVNHAMTVGFTGVGASVRLTATSWPIRPCQPAVGTVVHTTELH